MTELAPNAGRFDPLPPDKAALWSTFGAWEREYFPSWLGLRVEEIRQDYARMRLPFRPELEQTAGVVHGGAIASLIDTTVVPAIGSAYDVKPDFLTVSMNVQFLGAVREEDTVAEGWVEQRGRSIVFCRVEVRGATTGRLTANGTLIYKVREKSA
jgi:uncharacterized protein (TIGR00369 family)